MLEIIPSGKTVDKTEAELKKGSYWIRKAHDHDHSRETLAEPSVHNESVSQYHQLEKKLNEDLSRMGELEDQLKSTIMKTRRCRIQEKIRNLRKLIKKEKTELEREMPTRMRLAMRLLQIPTRNRSDREKSGRRMP